MSRVYDALKKLEAERSQTAPAPPATLDSIRLEQFVDLQRSLLRTGGGDADLPARLVHGVATFLGATAAAVGVVEEGAYRLVATHGPGYEDRSRHECANVDASDLAPVLRVGRPLVRQHRLEGGEVVMREIVLPIRGDVTGALHLVLPDGTTLGDEKVSLARVIADLVGIALANARG